METLRNRIGRTSKRLRAIAIGVAVAAVSPFAITQAAHEFLDRRLFDPNDSPMAIALFAMLLALVAMFAVMGAGRDLDGPAE